MPSRHTAFAILLAAALPLAGCGGHDENPADNVRTATVTFANPGNASDGGTAGESAQTVSIAVPGFTTKLNVPGLDLGAGNTALNGIALQPGSRLTGLKITGKSGDGSGGEGHGDVELTFTSPAAPAQVIAYYKQAAAGGGWTEVPPAAGQQFAATKPGARSTEHLAMQVGVAGAGSGGRILVTGS